MEEYEPYLILCLVSIMALLWLSHHFLHAHWWQRKAKKRLKRMREMRAKRGNL
jgi:hypothetical protein